MMEAKIETPKVESVPTVNPSLSDTPLEKVSKEDLKERVVDILYTCFDPEIPVNIYELGLIYSIDIDDNQNVVIKMTLTSPMCPVAGSLPPEVQQKVSRVAGVASSKVDLVWEPIWTKDMMSEAAKLQLGLM